MSSLLGLEDSSIEHNVGISVFWTDLLLVVSVKGRMRLVAAFPEFPVIQINHVIPLVLSILILTHLFPCHFCPRSIIALIMLFDPITIVPISVSTEIWPIIYHRLSMLQLLYIPSKILSVLPRFLPSVNMFHWLRQPFPGGSEGSFPFAQNPRSGKTEPA